MAGPLRSLGPGIGLGVRAGATQDWLYLSTELGPAIVFLLEILGDGMLTNLDFSRAKMGCGIRLI